MAASDLEPRQAETLFTEILPEMKQTFVSGLERYRRRERAEAKAAGRTELLLRQLGKKFGTVPKAIQAKLRNAPPADLDRWAENVLTAERLTDVFA